MQKQINQLPQQQQFIETNKKAQILTNDPMHAKEMTTGVHLKNTPLKNPNLFFLLTLTTKSAYKI